MFSFLLLANIFVIIGYIFTALLLTIGYFSFREKRPIIVLARLSTIMLAFYSLCHFLLWMVQLGVLLTKAPPSYGPSNGPVSVHFDLLFFIDISILLISVATLFLPFCKKHPVGILLPLGILINLHNIIFPLIPHRDADLLTQSLVDQQPATLFLFGALYSLLLCLLYIIRLWIKRILAEAPPPAGHPS